VSVFKWNLLRPNRDNYSLSPKTETRFISPEDGDGIQSLKRSVFN
jgi:hypothetical protein